MGFNTKGARRRLVCNFILLVRRTQKSSRIQGKLGNYRETPKLTFSRENVDQKTSPEACRQNMVVITVNAFVITLAMTNESAQQDEKTSQIEMSEESTKCLEFLETLTNVALGWLKLQRCWRETFGRATWLPAKYFCDTSVLETKEFIDI